MSGGALIGELRLAQLLKKKVTLLRRYQTMTGELTQAIEIENEEDLNEGLDRRAGLIEEIAELDRELVPLLERYRTPNPPCKNDPVGDLYVQMHTLLKETTATENANRKAMEKALSRAAEASEKSIRNTKNAVAYLKNMPCDETGILDVKK